MNLYKVVCVCKEYTNPSFLDVYVVALNPGTAQEDALAEVRERGLKYDDWVASVQLIASTDRPRPALLADYERSHT